MTESQRALVAAKIAQLQIGANQHTPIGVPSQRDAAELLIVSVRNVQRAKAVLDNGTPELVEAVLQNNE